MHWKSLDEAGILGVANQSASSKPQADMDLKQMFFTQLEREAAITHGTLERVSKRQFHQLAEPGLAASR
jgi:hypothetical protein